MSVNEILFVASTYFLIALVIAITAVFVLRIRFFGRFWLTFAVALFGSVAGGLLFEIDWVNRWVDALRSLNGRVNIFPPLFFSALLVWIFGKLSNKNH